MRAAVLLAAAPAALGRNVTGASEWETVRPGGRTACAFGTEYAFFAKRGSVNKIVFEFEGGGACWNAATCNTGTTYYTEVNVPGKLRTLQEGGVHEPDARNPFADWHHVFIPYCTGDIHSGDKITDYGQRTVHHVGHVNMQAALDWAAEHFPKDPTDVAAIGCSAGSLGAVINGPIAFNKYPSARHVVWGDAAWGIVTETMYNSAYPNWGWLFDPTNPLLSPDEMSKWRPQIGTYVWTSSAAHRPKDRFAVYTTNADAVQSGFYLLGGGNALRWTQNLRDEVSAAHDKGLGLGTFISPGLGHCASQTAIFYETEVQGVRLNQWVDSIVSWRDFDGKVDCKNEDTCTA
eukprot:TRINITY_DN10202_c0_g1_i1.p1 TRINITY_DN10202_c0_g1~~TRINITY_DN10202_c0_g1_i1.p1  ORF type:complete len:365 (+),score=109.80 TRINITY_DN10202_c0_g1_i1:57-1097(+)